MYRHAIRERSYTKNAPSHHGNGAPVPDTTIGLAHLPNGVLDRANTPCPLEIWTPQQNLAFKVRSESILGHPARCVVSGDDVPSLGSSAWPFYATSSTHRLTS